MVFQSKCSKAPGAENQVLETTAQNKQDNEYWQEKSKDYHQNKDSEIFYFPTRRIQRAGAIITIMFSAILLIGAITCLVNIERRRTGLRVGMIVIFTCLFAAVVGLLTNARRAEIFGSTAA